MSVIERNSKVMPHRTIRNCKKRTADLRQKGKNTLEPDPDCPKIAQPDDTKA